MSEDEGEWEEWSAFIGPCTCDHEEDEHGWGSCDVDGCECEAGWEGVTAVDELLNWLRQQLDEDERVALAANPAPWRRITDKAHLDPMTIFGGSYMGDQEKLRNVASVELSWVKDGNAEHITRWDPARVLAEVEAKRRILDLWSSSDAAAEFPNFDGGHATALEDVITALAQPYAGRPGWREEWAA